MASFVSGLVSGYAGGGKKSKDEGGKKIPGQGILKSAIDKMRGKGSKPPASDEEVRKAIPAGYKRGGRVKRTGTAKVHRGERILTKRQARRYKSRR